MNYLMVYHTDTGTTRKSNQDSLLLRKAITDHGEIALAAVCDGMGGLKKGELASKQVIVHLAAWFEKKLPKLLYEDGNDGNLDTDLLREQLDKVLSDENLTLSKYGESHKLRLGTTVVLILLYKNRYYLMNVGDSRCYRMSGSEVTQLSEDDSVVARDLRNGKITKEQALVDERINILTECIGVRPTLDTHFYTGEVSPGDGFLLCTDGFWHDVTDDEWESFAKIDLKESEETYNNRLMVITERLKMAGEKDNISSVYVRAC